MSGPAALPAAEYEPLHSLARYAVSAFGDLAPTHFLAAVALGVANSLFLALTYPDGLVSTPGLLLSIVALVGPMAATAAADRAGHRRSAWTSLASTYAVLVLCGLGRPSHASDLLIDQLMAHCLVLATVVADRAMGRLSTGRLAYIAAAFAGVTAGALLWAGVLYVAPDLSSNEAWRDERQSPWFGIAHPIYVALHWLLFGGAAVLLYGERRFARRTLERLRAAELERIARSRDVVESKLQAMQARIEPQFLFNTLAHVRWLGERDIEAAERMLDELVAFLRGAMPGMRSPSSTVSHEAELAHAYLRIVRIRLGDRLDFSIDVSPAAADARLPAMMLLPLVDQALVHGVLAAWDGGKLTITASVIDDRLHLVLLHTGGAFVADLNDPEITSVRERLRALYGASACLALRPAPGGGTEAVLQIPCERTS